jgi:hypothetical protein
MELNIQKSRIISFTRKTNSVHFNYYVSNAIILRSGSIKDLGVMLESKLYFRRHVDFVHSQALRKLGLTYWTQNNCELHWPLEVDTREGGGDRKTIAQREREHNPFLVLYDVKQV